MLLFVFMKLIISRLRFLKEFCWFWYIIDFKIWNDFKILILIGYGIIMYLIVKVCVVNNSLFIRYLYMIVN